MWRNNVLKVRERSFTALWRDTRRYSSQSLPITIPEFDHALNGILAPEGSVTGGKPRSMPTLGFAISGGVDSMALASLFARSKYSANSKHVQRAHAFIVDHKVRSESTEEAEWVAEQCRTKFGMQASVLTLRWPNEFDPLDHSSFETDARILRYQALGRACRAAGISELLVAHHADDQAETVLMRIANKRLRSGLQAMQPIEWIPECYGIHGVSHSGGGKRPTRHMPFAFEDGGVRILRPLLSFDKSRLIATCEQHNVAWVEDKTNHQQTYTLRNAIRHVLKNYKLPAALGVKELVKVSKDMQERVNWHRSQAHQLLMRCPKQLNLQVGSLLIQFPPLQELLNTVVTCSTSEAPRPNTTQSESYQLAEKPVEVWAQSDWNKAKNTAVCLLAQAGHFVSPRETPPIGELASTVANIWPEFQEPRQSRASKADNLGNSKSYSVHSIWWRKCSNSTLDPSSQSARPAWLLTRQPLDIRRADKNANGIVYPSSHSIPLAEAPPGGQDDRGEHDWQLFDGRWWISIKNLTEDTLILRHFTKADLDNMSPLPVARRRGPEQVIAITLALVKPADVRFTLPALFKRDSVTGQETLIGFPTLDVSMGTLGSPKDICTWRVRYKKLSNEFTATSAVNQNNGRDFDPGVTHAAIRDEMAKFDKTPNKRVTKFIRKRALKSDGAFSSKSTRSSVSKAHRSQLLDDSEFGNDDFEYSSVGSKRNTRLKTRTESLVPTSESQRRGRSESRKGGGYDIKWENLRGRS